MFANVDRVNGDLEVSALPDGANAKSVGSEGEKSSGDTGPLPNTPAVDGKKHKKRQTAITYSVFDLINTHQESVGNWADVANESPFSIVTQRSPEAERASEGVSVETQPVNDTLVKSNDEQASNLRHPPGLEHASYSRHVEAPVLPSKAPFEIKVANINYKSTEEDLFFFFGGEASVFNIRGDGPPGRGNGIAIVSFKSQEALANALNKNNMELLGRPLRISLRNQYPRSGYSGGGYQPSNDYSYQKTVGHYQHEGGYNTLPQMRRARLPPQPYNNYNTGKYGGSGSRFGPQQHFPNRPRDNRRHDYDNRSPRYSNENESNQIYPRISNRSLDSYNMPPRLHSHDNQANLNDYSGVQGEQRRVVGRARTESVRSNVTDVAERQERRKLELQPRTKPLNSADDELPARPTSIFGLAKPVDTYKKEKEIEERLRAEEEALKTTRERSRKNSSDHGASIPQSPCLFSGRVTILKPDAFSSRRSLVDGATMTSINSATENEVVLESLTKVSIKAKEIVNKCEKDDVVERSEINLCETTTYGTADTNETDSLAPEARRLSLNANETLHDVISIATLPRTKGTYNRTFTRSRDTFCQNATNKQNSAAVRRRRSKNQRNGAPIGPLNRDKRSAAGREKLEDNDAKMDIKSVSEKKEEGKHGVDKNESFEPKIIVACDQQHAKKEKKKQMIKKEMPKYVEPKAYSFSSQNKYAALLDTED